MSFLKIDDIEKISEFSKQDYQLIEIERKNMNNSDSFFREIMHEPFRIIGKISKRAYWLIEKTFFLFLY